MTLYIRELLAGGPAKLRWVYRYSGCRVRHPESVAEHSYFVALYGLLIAEWCEEHDEFVSKASVMEKAILHDLEEARTGDFPRNFKHSTPAMKSMLDDAGAIGFQQLIRMVVGDKDAQKFTRKWADAKDESKEGRIVEFADFLSVLGFLLMEGAGEGNQAVHIHVADMTGYFRGFANPKFDFIRPLVDQAGEIMKEVFGV